MERWFASRDGDRLQCALFLDKPVDDPPEFIASHIVVIPVLYNANRTLEIAMIGDLDNRQAAMLLVCRAKPAVAGTAVLYRRRVLERNGSRLNVRERLEKPVRVAGDKRLA